jgi:hypothetical protein
VWFREGESIWLEIKLDKTNLFLILGMEWFGVLFEWMDDIILLSFGADSQVNSHAQNHS